MKHLSIFCCSNKSCNILHLSGSNFGFDTQQIRETWFQKASDTSIQSHEDRVFQFASTDRGRFQTSEHRRQVVKVQIRLKTKRIEDDF